MPKKFTITKDTNIWVRVGVYSGIILAICVPSGTFIFSSYMINKYVPSPYNYFINLLIFVLELNCIRTIM